MSTDLRAIPHFPGYLADNFGQIWSTKIKLRGSGNVGGWTHGAPRLMSPHSDRYGYPRVRMMHETRKAKPYLVSRAVAAAFYGDMPSGLQTAHLNGNKADNRPNNLAYVTAQTNIDHRELHGTTARGDLSPHSKWSDEFWCKIIAQVHSGISVKSIVETYGVGMSTVYVVLSGRSRKHLTT